MSITSIKVKNFMQDSFVYCQELSVIIRHAKRYYTLLPGNAAGTHPPYSSDVALPCSFFLFFSNKKETDTEGKILMH
jgi:hypothetical protein